MTMRSTMTYASGAAFGGIFIAAIEGNLELSIVCGVASFALWVFREKESSK